MELSQLNRSRKACRGPPTRRVPTLQQAGGQLEDVQRALVEMDAQIQQLIENNDDQEVDVKDVADLFNSAEKTRR